MSIYCSVCDKKEIDPKAPFKIRAKGECAHLSSRIGSHLNITKKTFQAHPLSSALIGIALCSSIVAGAALFATGLGVPGAVFIFVGAGVLGGSVVVFYFFRTQEEAEEYKSAHALNDARLRRIAGKKVCLVLEATEDPNGALKWDKGPAQLEKKYPIVFAKVSSIEEVKRAIDQVSKVATIQVLWFSAHGSRHSLSLGKKTDISMTNIDDLEEDFGKLEENATLVLKVCKTAKGEENIAKRMSKVAHRRVLGSPFALLNSDVQVKMGREARVGIVTGPFPPPHYLEERFKALKVYRDGVLEPVQGSFVTI